MKPTMRSQFFLGCLLAFLAMPAAGAQQTATRSYPLPAHGAVEFKIPSAWKDQLQQVKGTVPPTITWTQPGGADFRVLVTVGWQEADARLTEAELKDRVEKTMALRQSQAEEKQLSIQELKGSSAHGYYFAATDRAPKPGEHRHLAQGIVLVDDLIVAFTILTNDGQESVVTAALGAIRSAAHHNK